MESKLPPLQDESILSPLRDSYEAVSNTSLKALFQNDSERFNTMLVCCGDLKIDFSKNLVDQNTITNLCNLAKRANLYESISDLYQGEPINNTEHRAALHTALRAPNSKRPEQVRDLIEEAQSKFFKIAKKVTEEQWLGYSGKPIKNIVNIGIGGSDLGPAMTTTALDAYKINPNLQFHFVSNVDPTDITQTLEKCEPSTTLFIVASKTFTTLETLSNATTAKQWFLNACDNQEQHVQHHFIAISTNLEKVKAFGISESSILPMWDWVGGRYSIWSTIALPLCISIGEKEFKAFLDGAHQIDEHFMQAEVQHNGPAMLGLLSIWYSHFFKTQSHGILCYEHYLDKFPDYLQQLDMESNGKSVTKDGKNINYKTGIPVWGNVGSNSQHSFHQLFHQGTTLVPVDFIVGMRSCNPNGDQHTQLFSNCIAQSQALMLGRTEAEVVKELENQGLDKASIEKLTPHKLIAGNKPSTTITYPKLTPSVLGQLIALYEHKIFTQSVIWGINPFDQWGVELGKVLSNALMNELSSEETSKSLDQSTYGLIEQFKSNQ